MDSGDNFTSPAHKIKRQSSLSQLLQAELQRLLLILGCCTRTHNSRIFFQRNILHQLHLRFFGYGRVRVADDVSREDDVCAHHGGSRAPRNPAGNERVGRDARRQLRLAAAAVVVVVEANHNGAVTIAAADHRTIPIKVQLPACPCFLYLCLDLWEKKGQKRETVVHGSPTPTLLLIIPLKSAFEWTRELNQTTDNKQTNKIPRWHVGGKKTVEGRQGACTVCKHRDGKKQPGIGEWQGHDKGSCRSSILKPVWKTWEPTLFLNAASCSGSNSGGKTQDLSCEHAFTLGKTSG